MIGMGPEQGAPEGYFSGWVQCGMCGYDTPYSETWGHYKYGDICEYCKQLLDEWEVDDDASK